MIRRPLSASDLNLAKRVLRSFDIVLVTEWLAEFDIVEWVCWLLGTSKSGVGNIEWLNEGRKLEEKTGVSDTEVPAEIGVLLEKENALDIELYKFAKVLLRHRLATWKETGEIFY